MYKLIPNQMRKGPDKDTDDNKVPVFKKVLVPVKAFIIGEPAVQYIR
jgi:hypothetical protein